MITGDNRRTAKAIAEKMGIDEFHAELSPEEKVKIIEELKKNRRVAMVGDGVNDAPALARADVGIAMGIIGSDVALETADVALMQDDLTRLSYLVNLSKRTVKVMKANILASILVKGAFAVLAFPGIVALWMAVGIGDMGLSLAVVLNAMTLSILKPQS
jgi:Cd2+/Zn2+-exporting ATPase